MVASILIIVFSVALLIYWFRYSCILLLRSELSAAPATTGAEQDRFRIAEVQAQLQTDAQLDPLHASLQRDHALLMYLIEHAAGLELRSVEDRLLLIDYKLMQCWYRLTRTAAPVQARQAL